MSLCLKLKLGLASCYRAAAAAKNAVYGVTLRDTGTGLDFERAGTIAGIPLGEVPENKKSLLKAHNQWKRCIVGHDGNLKYYTDPRNSMWKLGSYKQQSIDNANGTIISADDRYALGEYEVVVSGEVSIQDIGKTMNIYDGFAENFWDAIIIDADTVNNTYTLSHPHIDGFGSVPPGNTAYYMIGDAVLGGQDGNFMVEVPGFWYKKSYEPSLDDDAPNRVFRGWAKHLISLKSFPGAVFFPKRYISATEGVSANADGECYDGWIGTFDNVAPSEGSIGGFRWASPEPTATPAMIKSAAGYYPRTQYSPTNFRTACEANGEGYHQYDFASNKIIQLFMMIEYASMNTQLNIANGISNLNSTNWSAYNGSRPMRKTGDTIRAGNNTWDMSALKMKVNMLDATDAQRQIQSFSYRGVENPYGHIFKWVDGFLFIQRNPAEADSYHEAWATPAAHGGVANYNLYKSHSNFAAVSTDANYSRLKGLDGEDLEIINISRYWKAPSLDLLPNDDKTSPSSGDRPNYSYDYFYQGGASEGDHRVFAVGGIAHNGVHDGAFCVHSTYGFGSTNAPYGGRLCKI